MGSEASQYKSESKGLGLRGLGSRGLGAIVLGSIVFGVKFLGFGLLGLLLRFRWLTFTMVILLILLYAIGNAEFRAPFLEKRLRTALAGAAQDIQFQAEDVFIQVVPWRGQLRMRLNQAQVTYDMAFSAPIDAEDLRLDIPIWRLIRGDVRPSGVAVRGIQLELQLSDELAALVPEPEEQRSAEETWGFVFNPTWIETLQQTLPIYVFSHVQMADVTLRVRDPSGTQALFDLMIQSASAQTPLGFGTDLKGRDAHIEGALKAPGGQVTTFTLDAELQPNHQFRAHAVTDVLIPSHYYTFLRLLGLKTPERLTTPYRLRSTLDLDPENGRQTAGLVLIEGRGADTRQVAVANARANRQTQDFDLTTEVSGIDLRRLAPWTPYPEFLEDLSLITDGTLDFSWNRAQGDWQGVFALTNGSGTLAIPTIGLPSKAGEVIGVMDVSAKGVFDRSGISLQDMRVATGSDQQPGPVLIADLVAKSSSDGTLMTLDLRSPALNQGDLFFIWPKSVATKSRNDVASFVTAGAFSDLNFTGVYRLSGQEDGRTNFQLEGQQLVADFQTAQVQLTAHLPPLTNANGRLSLIGGRLDVEVDQANMDQMQLTQGRTSIDFSTPNWLALTVESPMRGPLAPALRILAEGEIGLEGLADLPIDQIQADASGDLRLGLGFDPKTVAELGIAREHIHVDANLNIQQLQIADFLFGQGVQDGTLNLNINDQSLSGHGEVLLDDILGQITVSQSFAPDTPGVLEVVAETSVPGKKVRRFVPGLEEFLSGTAQGQFIYRSEQGRDARLSVDLDLEDLTIDFPALVYTKNPGQSGTLTLDLILDANGPTGAENLRLRAPNLGMNATLDLTAEDWVAIDISTAQVNATEFRGFRVENRGDYMWARVENGELDVGSLLDQFTSKAAGAQNNVRSSGALGFSLNQPLVIEQAYFQRLNFGSDAYMSDARLSLVLNDDGLRGYTLNAAVPANGPDEPGGRVDSRLVQRDGGFFLSLNADNLGALMQAVDMNGEVRGGQFSLSGESPYPLGGGPWTLRGGTSSDLRIYEISSLVRVLSLVSLTGILEQMSGSGLVISNFDFAGILDAPRLDIDHLKFGGASLGLTMSGGINWSEGVLDLRGALAPFNLVNLLFEHIPLIGDLVTGVKKEGLIATQFSIQGSTSQPDVHIEALSTIQPGILRSIIDEIEGNGG